MEPTNMEFYSIFTGTNGHRNRYAVISFESLYPLETQSGNVGQNGKSVSHTSDFLEKSKSIQTVWRANENDRTRTDE